MIHFRGKIMPALGMKGSGFGVKVCDLGAKDLTFKG